MSKMHLRIGAYPAWNNDVRCDTWFAISGKLAARRDWMLYSADGAQALAASTSTWLLVNTETRKLGRIPPERIEAYKELTPTEPLHALDADEEKLAPRPPQEGDDAQALVASLGMGVRRTDTDMNQHVNNGADSCATCLSPSALACARTRWPERAVVSALERPCSRLRIEALLAPCLC